MDIKQQVLNVLAERPTEEVKGIEIANAIGGLRRAQAYVALAKLQRDGMITARWDTSGRRPTRVFRIVVKA